MSQICMISSGLRAYDHFRLRRSDGRSFCDRGHAPRLRRNHILRDASRCACCSSHRAFGALAGGRANRRVHPAGDAAQRIPGLSLAIVKNGVGHQSRRIRLCGCRSQNAGNARDDLQDRVGQQAAHRVRRASCSSRTDAWAWTIRSAGISRERRRHGRRSRFVICSAIPPGWCARDRRSIRRSCNPTRM